MISVAVLAADDDPPRPRRSGIEIILRILPDQRAVLPDILRLRHGCDGPARRHRMHGGLNDIGHDIAGGENDGARLDLAVICEPNTHRPRRRRRMPLPRPRTTARRARQPARAARAPVASGSASAAPGETIAPARAMPNAVEQHAHGRENRRAARRARASDALRAIPRCYRPPQDTANSCRACRRQCRAAAPAISGRRRHRGWRDRRARRARSHRLRSVAVSGRSISHSSIEVEAAVLPRPGNSRSTMMTSRPCRVRRSATSEPVMPAPTISASHFRFSPTSRRSGCPDFANHGERPPRRSACSVSSESRMLITNL